MTDAPIDRPERIPEAFAEAWNDRDPVRLASLFDEDAEFVNVTGLWWHDRAAIERVHAYGLAHIFNESTLRIVKVEVKRLSDDVAVVHARMRLTGQSPIDEVSEPGERHNIFSFVVRRTSEGWSCASAHNTDVVPNMETNVVDEEGRLRSANYGQYRNGG